MAQTYYVRVRIVEARNIELPTALTRGPSLPSPYVEVEVCGEVQYTPVAEETSTYVWNSTLLFSNIRLSPAQFKRLEARVHLRSANVLVPDYALGCVTLDLPGIFEQVDSAGHMADTWVALPDAERPERTVAFVRLEVWVGVTGSVVESVMSASDAAAVAASDASASLDASGALLPVGVPDVRARGDREGGAALPLCGYLCLEPLCRFSGASTLSSPLSSAPTACLR